MHSLRRRTGAGVLMALAAVAAVVALICYAAWAVLVGQQLVLGGSLQQVGPDAGRDLVRDLRPPQSSRESSRDITTTPTSSSQSSRPATAARGTRPTRIDGGLVALLVAGGAIGAGFMIQRAILRRFLRLADDGADQVRDCRGPEPTPDATPPAPGPESTVSADDERDDADLGSSSPGESEDTDAAERQAVPLEGDVVRSVPAGPDTTPAESVHSVTGSEAGQVPRRRVVLYDHRMNRRVALRAPVRLQWPGHDLACTAETLSIWGLRCFIPGPGAVDVPAVGSSVRITVTLSGALLPLSATVTYTRSRQDGDVVGVRFGPLDEPYRDFLLAFIGDADATDDADGGP